MFSPYNGIETVVSLHAPLGVSQELICNIGQSRWFTTACLSERVKVRVELVNCCMTRGSLRCDGHKRLQ
jgi:hypothetical protein